MFLIPPLLGLVGQLMPSLIGLFAGSKAQAVATQVVAVAQAVTGTATQEDAHAALVADPAKAAALQAQLAKIAVDSLTAENADRNSARQMAVTTKENTPAVLAWLVTLGFFGLLGVMSFMTLPAANTQVLNILLGSLGTGWTMILSYYFGASATGTVFPSLGGGSKSPLAP